MQTKKTVLASALVALLLAPAATFAAESFEDNSVIYDRSIDSIKATLAEYGIDARSVETWGQALRVQAVAADGSTYTVLVDKSSLQPLTDANGVATRTDLGLAPSNAGWTVSDAVSNPVSFND